MASRQAVSKGSGQTNSLKIADIIGGRGGGKPTLAQGRAPDSGKLSEAIAKAPGDICAARVEVEERPLGRIVAIDIGSMRSEWR